MSILAVRHISKAFGGFRAVDDVSFNVEEGAIHAVIGPNGAGKSTMFNLLTGHLRPAAGAVVFDGVDITGRRPAWMAKSGIARAFQITSIFPRLSVLECVECAVAAQRRRSASLLISRRTGARVRRVCCSNAWD